MTSPCAAVLLLLGVVWVPLPAADVEVLLTTGERCYGGLVRESSESVVMDRRVWSPQGAMVSRVEYPRSRISQVEVVSSLAALYAERAKGAPKTYDGQYTLVRWCMERGLQSEAFAIAKGLYDQDPKDLVTRELVESTGYILDQGTWLSRDEYRAKHGLTSFGGKLMQPAEADARRHYLQLLAAIRDSDVALADLQVQQRNSIDILRTATVALKREERHQRQEKEEAETKRRAAMTPDQVADEEEAHRFDAEHHIVKTVPPEPDALIALKKALDTADKNCRTAQDRLTAEGTHHDALVADRDQTSQTIAQLANQAGRPTELPEDKVEAGNMRPGSR